MQERKFKVVVRYRPAPYFIFARNADEALGQVFDRLESYDSEIVSVDEVI